VRGDLKIEALAPDSCFRKGTQVRVAGDEHGIEAVHTGGRTTLLKLSGIDDRETARELRGELVQVPEDSLEPLPAGEYYRFQLIGLKVTTADGRDLGTLSDVLATGSADVYTLEGPLGEVLIPATAEVIADIDLTAGTMIVNPLPGLLPDE
jgi:16S rRNA processing protein RimM